MKTSILPSPLLCLLTLIAGFIYTGCSGPQEQINSLSANIDSLQIQNEVLKTQCDSLRKQLTTYQVEEDWIKSKIDSQAFANHDISDPETYIRESLQNEPELIPAEPGSGVSMQFDNIQILGPQWVIADYKNGQRSGSSIYKFLLQEDGSLKFHLLDSYRPE